MRVAAVIVVALCACACAGYPKLPTTAANLVDSPDLVTVYALGDWGTGNDDQHAVAYALAEDVRTLSRRSEPPIVLGLGDNIYDKGLSRTEPWGSAEVAYEIWRTFGNVYDDVTLDGTPVTFHVVPGNHDHGRALTADGRYGDIAHVESTAESLYTHFEYHPIAHALHGLENTNDKREFDSIRQWSRGTDNLYLPDVVVDTERLGVFAIDSQAILSLFVDGQPDRARQHFNRLAELLDESSAVWKFVIGHHPIRTHGLHGGHAPLSHWLWKGPRAVADKKRWVPPLPFVYAPFVLGDQLIAQVQDTDHPANRSFQRGLLEAMRRGGSQVYLAGHDHCLQLIDLRPELRFDGLQIVSGSAGKRDAVRGRASDLVFSTDELGFIRVDIDAHALWITAIEVDRSTREPRRRIHARYRYSTKGTLECAM